MIANKLTLKYYNGTEYVDVAYSMDESEGFTKDGFTIFSKPSTWQKSNEEGSEKYFIKVIPSVDHTLGTTIRGLGVLFSNDLDLVAVRSNIVSKHNNGDSWLGKHEQARKEIMQELNNKGYRKISNSDKANPLVEEGAVFSSINEFDILEPAQLRVAATYLVLSMIYLDELSDEDGDKWERQGKRYQDKFYRAFNIFYLKLDSNDDGIEDDTESASSTATSLSWT